MASNTTVRFRHIAPLGAAWVLWASLLCCAASAQAPEAAADKTGDGAQTPRLDTPRATVRTFLDSMNAVQAGNTERLAAALACLHLGEGPDAIAPDQAEGLALQLYEVIDQFTLRLESIPERVEGATAEVILKEDAEDGREILLGLRQYEGGAWRFQSSTLKQIPQVRARLRAEPQGNGLLNATDPKLCSPRATMRTFVEGMNRWEDGGREDALWALDLFELKEQVRQEQGEVLADYLKQVLDRDRLVVYQEIPDDPAGGSYVHIRNPKGNVAIAPVERAGVVKWQFSAETIEALPDLYEEYKDRPVVAGVVDAQPKVFSVRLRQWVDGRFPFLLGTAFLLENWQWLGLLAIILAGMAVSRLLTLVLLTVLRKWFRSKAMSLDRKLETGFVRPIRIAVMAWVWFLGLKSLGLPPDTLFYLRGAAKAVSAAGAVWAFYRLIDILGRYLEERARRTENKFDDVLVPLTTRSLKIFVATVGVVFVAETLGFEPASLLAGLGLGGLAFALAAKDTVSNIFGSLTILIDQPFQIGDWVIIGDAEGSVERVGIRSTRVRTFYNSLVTIPNSQIINATIDNMGARRYRRIKTMIAVTYDTPPEKIEAFCEGIRHLIRIHPYTRKDYYHVWLNEFADHSLNILLYCFHEVPDWATELRERHRLFLDIIRLAERLSVEFAFPTQTLYMRPDTQPASEAGPAPPENAATAYVLGRKEAEEIVEESLGKSAPPPPPVSFDTPPGSPADTMGDGDESP